MRLLTISVTIASRFLLPKSSAYCQNCVLHVECQKKITALASEKAKLEEELTHWRDCFRQAYATALVTSPGQLAMSRAIEELVGRARQGDGRGESDL